MRLAGTGSHLNVGLAANARRVYRRLVHRSLLSACNRKLTLTPSPCHTYFKPLPQHSRAQSAIGDFESRRRANRGPGGRSRRCHCQRLMNDIYKPGETLLRIQDGHQSPEGSRGNSVIAFLAHPLSCRRHPRRQRFGSPVTVARPHRSAAGGTLFQEPSGVSWIVLEHLPDVQKSCRLSGNCNAVVAATALPAIMRCASR